MQVLVRVRVDLAEQRVVVTRGIWLLVVPFPGRLVVVEVLINRRRLRSVAIERVAQRLEMRLVRLVGLEIPLLVARDFLPIRTLHPRRRPSGGPVLVRRGMKLVLWHRRV